jgi:predicted metal-dependent phosphoesterase TrpH
MLFDWSDFMKADLHAHTTHSDGTKTVKEVIDLAHQNGMTVFSITDHDIVKDVTFAKEYASSLGMTFIPGVELSTLHRNKSVHVLGYFKNEGYKSSAMNDYYKMIKEGRENRARQFIINLKKYYDIEITYESVLSFSRGIIARPHIGKAINQAYPEYSFDYIFDHFIGDYSEAYVPSTQLPVEEGVKLLRNNGAIAVLAHPTLLKKHIKEEVLAMDFDGIEARYYRNKKEEEKLYRKYAEENRIVITAGSDYHGIENDTKHGMVGEIYIDGTDLNAFLDVLKEN